MGRKLKLDELGRISAAEFKSANKIPLSLILENIRSGVNIGAIFRTADAFRVEKIWITGYSPAPPHREIQRSALGATESVAWERADSAVELAKRLKSEGCFLAALEQTEDSQKLREFVPPGQPVVVALGNEVEGVSQELVDLCDVSLEIEQYGSKHSLNVSIAAGLLMYDLYYKLTQ